MDLASESKINQLFKLSERSFFFLISPFFKSWSICKTQQLLGTHSHITNEQNVSRKSQLCTTTQCRKCLVSCSNTVWEMACFMFKVCNWVQFSSIHISNEETRLWNLSFVQQHTVWKFPCSLLKHSVENALFLAHTQCGEIVCFTWAQLQ